MRLANRSVITWMSDRFVPKYCTLLSSCGPSNRISQAIDCALVQAYARFMADQKQNYDPKQGGKFEPTTKAKPAPNAVPGDNKNKKR